MCNVQCKLITWVTGVMSSISKAGAGVGVDVQLECSASASKKETPGMRQVSQYQIVDIVELFFTPK